MAHGHEEWLTEVWRKCLVNRTPVNFGQIYTVYETLVDPNERGFALGSGGLPTDFPEIPIPQRILDALDDDGESRGAALYVMRHNEEDDDPLLMGGINTGAGYLYFPSNTYREGESRHRVVVNVSSYNKLIRMMRIVVREMTKPGGLFHDVNGAKVMTQACFQHGRNDTLIIYTRDRKTADLVLFRIGMWIAEGLFSARDFGALLPKTIRKVYTGVGYACEPPQDQVLASYDQTLSYGKYLSQIIYIATAIALTAGLKKNVPPFIFLATYVLQLAGTKAPEEPYEFGAVSPIFAGCLPWDDLAPWGAERQEQIKRTKLFKEVAERTEIAFSYFG